MKLLVKLVYRDLKAHIGRTLVSFSAILISIFLVVWMMGNVDTLLSEFKDEAKQYMGEYHVSVIPQAGRPSPGQVLKFRDASLINDIAHAPEVEQLGLYEQRRYLIGSDNLDGGFDEHVRLTLGIPPQSPTLVGTNVDTTAYELVEGEWPKMSSEKNWVGVIGSACAKHYKVKLGDEMKIRSGEDVYAVCIVGMVQQAQSQPGVMMGKAAGGPAVSSLFVPQSIFEIISKEAFSPNLVQIQLKEGVVPVEFRKKWELELKNKGAAFFDVDAMVHLLSSSRSVVQQKESAKTAVWLVLVCSLFIMFTSLSIGVQQKMKQLSMLRIVGFTRKQVSAYVVIESLFMCIPAMIAGIGAGLLLMMSAKGEFDWLSLIKGDTLWMVCLCAIGSCLLASIIPALRASRVSVLDSSSGEKPLAFWKFRPWMLLLALGLLSLQPLIVFYPNLELETRKWLFSALGFTGLALGACLLVPFAVAFAEKLGGKWGSRLMGIPTSLMKLQLSRQMGRSVSTVIAMSVGMTIFLAVQIWGYSMLVPFSPSSKTPGTLISFLNTELSPDDVVEALKQPILKNSRLYPIYVEQPNLGAETKAPRTAGLSPIRSVVLAGLPLDDFIQGKEPLLKPDFVEGNPHQAWKELKETRSVLVPSTFARTCDLHVGDMIYFEEGSIKPALPSNRKSKGQAWTIAGVIDYPGWHWLTKTSGLRVKGGRSEAICIADEKWVKQAYPKSTVKFLWGATPSEISADALQDDLSLWIKNKRGGSQDKAQISPLVKALTYESIAESVTGRGDQVIFTMSQLPLIMMIIASLSVVNALMASIHSRKRELSLMRVIGVSWSTIWRMIWLESLLIVGAAGLLSFAVGTLAAWSSIQILAYGYVFGIVTPPIHFPWLHLLGVALLMFILAGIACWIALRGVKKITTLSLR